MTRTGHTSILHVLPKIREGETTMEASRYFLRWILSIRGRALMHDWSHQIEVHVPDRHFQVHTTGNAAERAESLITIIIIKCVLELVY
jgi:hypothetical protein